MNEWIKIAEDTYEMLVEGGSVIRYTATGYAAEKYVAMVFVPKPVRK